MGIRRRESGRWQARITLDGQPYAELFDTEAEAADWLTVMQARKITGTLPGRTVTVRAYAGAWLTTYATAPRATREYHERNVRLYIVPALGGRALADVTPSEVARVLLEIRARVSAAKAEHVYRTLSALFRAAADDRLLLVSPVIASKHRPRRQKAPAEVLERAEARAVLMQMQGWQRDTALLLIGTGARFSEVAGLTPHDVTGTTVRFVRRNSRGTVRAIKNHRARTVAVPELLVPMIARLTAQTVGAPPIGDLADREWPAARWDRHWLVQTSTGKAAANGPFGRALHAAVAGAGIPKRVTPHGLRHTYVSWMIDEGHSADKIAHWIGDTPETVRAVYSHMLEASSAPAAAAIDAALRDLG